MNIIASADDALIELSLQDFSRQFHSTFPLRNFTAFYDGEKFREKILRLKEDVSKNFYSKVWNRDEEEVVSLVKKLRERMNKKVVAEWTTKNERHKIQSVSFLQKRTETLCGDFQMELEDQLLLNPDMEMDSLKNYVERRKLLAVCYFDGIWNHAHNQIKDERKAKMVKNLDAIVEEVLDKQKHVLERKSVDEGNKLVEEVKTIIMEKSRQLKSYIQSRPKCFSKRYLKAELEDMNEYLLNGKGSTVRENEKEIYAKLVETLESGIKFLSEEEEGTKGNGISPVDVIQWVEGFDLKLKSICSNEVGVDDTQTIEDESNGCDSTDRGSWISMQQILNEGPFGFWEQDKREPGRRHKDDGDDSMTGRYECEESEEIRIVERPGSKADECSGPTRAARRRTRLRRSSPLNSPVTEKDQTLIIYHNHVATHDGPLPKKRRSAGNVSMTKKTGTKADGFLHRETSGPTDNSGNAAQAKPSRRSSRLKCYFPETDPTKESTSARESAPNHSSSSGPEDESTTGTDTLKRSKRNFRNTDKVTNASTSSEISEFSCSYSQATLSRKNKKNFRERDLTKESTGAKVNATNQSASSLHGEMPEVEESGSENAEKSTKASGECIELRLPSAQTTSSRTNRCVKKNEPDVIEESNDVRINASSQYCDGETPDRITILGEDPPRYKCDVCEWEIRKKGSFKYHGKYCRSTSRQHKCDHCGKRFYKKEQLVIHTRIHTGEKPFKCSTCNKQFRQIGQLHTHMHSHRENDRFICEKCKQSFKYHITLKRHMLNHEGKLPFGCSYCDQGCASMPHLLTHVLTHSDERPFNCVTCDKLFSTKQELVRHLKRAHRQQKEDADKQANDASLEYLRKVTNNPNYDGDISSTVVLTHAIKKANLRVPDVTDRASSSQVTSSRGDTCPEVPLPDQITIVGRRPLQYKCDVCGNEIKRRCEFKYHGKNCNKNGHECHHCEKRFPFMYALLNHLRTHTGEKPFKCPTCNKQFAQKHHLQAHTHSHTRKVKPAPFSCEMCKRAFWDRYTLKRHIMLKHEGKLPFGCKYCDQRCDSIVKLKEHVIIHCDERPYKCSTCERSFSRKRQLVCHFQRMHRQPREDANKFASEAGADYLRKVTNNPNYDGAISGSTVLSYAIKKANLKILE